MSGDIIARLLGFLEWEDSGLDELVKLYCRGCFDHEQYAALDDAGDVDDERVALQRVFIDLDVNWGDENFPYSGEFHIPKPCHFCSFLSSRPQ